MNVLTAARVISLGTTTPLHRSSYSCSARRAGLIVSVCDCGRLILCLAVPVLLTEEAEEGRGPFTLEVDGGEPDMRVGELEGAIPGGLLGDLRSLLSLDEALEFREEALCSPCSIESTLSLTCVTLGQLSPIRG